jgi:hypothetical protein
MQQKLQWLSPNCPLGVLPPLPEVEGIQPEVIQEEADVAQQRSSAAS